MWVFNLISLPLTLGMVLITLKYFAGPNVPHYVFFTVGYAWFCSLSIIVIVPADIWTTIVGHYNWVISFFWTCSYWSTFMLTWAVVPLLEGYEDAGDFTVTERLKTSIHRNLVFYLTVGSIALIGLILLISMRKNLRGGALGFAMACSNTFGLVTGAFLLGFGLSEIPRSLWKEADWTIRQKVLSHKIAKMAMKLDDAHQNFSNAIMVAQVTSNQMSKRDPLRPYMDVIDKLLAQIFKEDPSFKPQGGRLGENDLDYDADEKSMATLRRHLRVAQEQYYRYKSEYLTCVLEALELEDIIKNYDQRDATGWKYVSSLRRSRAGTIGSILDTVELLWRCILVKQLQRLLAVILGCMSIAILLAEATLLPSIDLSLFSLLINSVRRKELFVQAFERLIPEKKLLLVDKRDYILKDHIWIWIEKKNASISSSSMELAIKVDQVCAFIPLMYMCICTYYSLFKVGMLAFYSLTPRQTNSVSLLMIVSMVARYAPPISYNFLNLIRLDGNAKTIFEQRMGNIDEAVPFFGTGFNRIYPLIMVIYTILVASNCFDQVIGFFGSWRILKNSEADNMDGFDPSGMIILQRERSWLEQGHQVGEQVIPLARSFSSIDSDNNVVDIMGSSSRDDTKARNVSKQYSGNRESISHKYAGIREQNRQTSSPSTRPSEDNTMMASAKMSLLKPGTSNSSPSAPTGAQPSGFSSKWQTMKSRLQNFKTNIGSKRFLPLKQTQDIKLDNSAASSESLDQIFQRLKRPPTEHLRFSDVEYDDDGDDDEIIKSLNSRR